MSETVEPAAEAVTAAAASVPLTPLAVRLDRIRRDCEIQVGILWILLGLAETYLTLPEPDDARFVAAMVDMRDRFKIAMERTRDLEREHADAQATREAAEEFEPGRRKGWR